MKESRITAYALGELHGPKRTDFEKELAASAALQEELERVTTILRDLETLPPDAAAFTAEQRKALRQRCLENIARNNPTQKVVAFPRRGILLGLAAAALLCLGLFVFLSDDYSPSPQDLAKTPVAAPTPLTVARVDATPQPTAESISQPTEPGLPLPLDSDRALAAAPAQFAEGTTLAGEAGGLVDYGSPLIASAPASTTAEAPSRMQQPSAIQSFTSGWSRGSGAGTGVRARATVALVETVPSMPTIPWNTEEYNAITENEFVRVADHPLSTFSIDVDTASYANVRRFLQAGELPPAGAIRTEEMINYFAYEYPTPEGDAPLAVDLALSQSPWSAERQLVRVALASPEISAGDRPASNLVFLIDVSGSMTPPDRLPLLREGLKALVRNLSERDRVAIVVYAGSSGLVLPSTPGSERSTILEALDRLEAGGSTHGAAGIRQAYEVARANFLPEGNNRVILATDGDFNVGVTNQSELKALIEKERESGVFLTVLGVGRGNLNDATMKLLAQYGNGQYFYLDSPLEARRVLVEQLGSTLYTVAKDVKIQVEFNPALVAGYRLVGYENRLLAQEDFNNDARDAGEMGAGHRVTAFYEIIPAGQPIPGDPTVDPLKYQPTRAAAPLVHEGEILTVKIRYKEPNGETSRLMEFPLPSGETPALEAMSEDFRFATAVAAFAGKLRGSVGADAMGWAEIQNMARGALGADPGSHRAEFLTLVERAKVLSASPAEELE